MVIGIIGLGLIGGSIAKALKEKTDIKIVAMNRSEKSLIDAYNDGVIDEYSLTDMSIFNECDIIIVCTTVDTIPTYVSKLKPFIKNDCIITDVGSTKKKICDTLSNVKDICFIGGHPMAGSEQTGYKSAKAHLFENAFYIFTPINDVPQSKINQMTDIAKILGATPVVISPEIHDYTVAAISHVPHIIASSLVNTVKNLADDNGYMHSFAAGGFRDITRIASSSPDVWNSICQDNREPILKVLDTYIETIKELKKSLERKEDIYSFFESARDYRNTFESRNENTVCKFYEIAVDVVDQPGAIATIATLLSVNSVNIKNIGIRNTRDYNDGALYIAFENESHKNRAIDILKSMNYKVFNK